jgi:hypothetical protein
MMPQFTDRLRRVCSDRAGTSTIEAALILPLFLALLAGMSDFAMSFAVKLRTQQAAARTIEYATSAGLERLSLDDLRNEAAAAAQVPLSQVVVLRWLECGGVRQSVFEAGCDSGQELARYASVRISNSYRPILKPFLPATMAKDGLMRFQGFASARLQ